MPDAGKWVTINGAHVFIGEGGLIEKGPKDLVGTKPGPEAKPGHNVWYHGTRPEKVSGIRANGLNAPENAGAKWFMLTTSHAQAKRYAGEGGSVLEYHIPEDLTNFRLNKESVLWPSEEHSAYDYEARAAAIRRSIPEKYLAAVHEYGEKRNDSAVAKDLSDFETAEAIRDGKLSSPQQYGDFWLFDLRITGTGMAYRDSLEEWAFRDPEVWTSPEFVQRCNGLPVIFNHPETGGLDADYYRENAIGTIILPYVKGAEVWGIAKIFDADAAVLMQTTHKSTSPGVTPPKGAEAISLEGGAQVLDEGLPLILDHLAVCELGVWDKDGPPQGIRLDSSTGKGENVAEKTAEDLLREQLADAQRRVDSAEAERDDAKKRADAAEEEAEKARADKAKRDADEAAAAEAEEREQREKADAKDKARKDRHDAEKHDGKHNDCAKCDAAEAEGEGDRKDGAPVEEVNANREEAIKDSRIAKLEAELQAIKAGQMPLSHDEANAVAAAFHRADSVYQMLGEQTPQILPGERPAAYRRRLADGLRKHTKSFATERIHDAVSGAAFDILEDRIYAEALAEAKNPSRNDAAGVLREVVTVAHGKTRKEFYGDSRVAWAPFMPAIGLKILGFNKSDVR